MWWINKDHLALARAVGEGKGFDADKTWYFISLSRRWLPAIRSKEFLPFFVSPLVSNGYSWKRLGENFDKVLDRMVPDGENLALPVTVAVEIWHLKQKETDANKAELEEILKILEANLLTH